MAPVNSEGWWDKNPSKRVTVPKKRERSVENPVVAYAKKLGILVRKMNGLGFRGWPDRLFVLPSGKAVWIEFKAPGEKNSLSEGQKEVIEELRSRKHEVYVIDDKEVGKAIIDECLLRATQIPRTSN